MSNLADASFRMSKISWGDVRLFFRIFIHSGSRCWWCYKKGWWWCFSVFLESLILTVCWYGTGRFINSKVTPHVRKSWGCEGFRTLRRESRFSSFMGPSLKEFLSRWWWWCWEGELRSSSSACIFFSVSLWLIPAHASPLPLLLTQYIASPLHLLQRIHPYFISIPELSLPMDTNGPMSTTPRLLTT